MEIGDKIRIRREEINISQVELARRIGVTQSAVANYESGLSNPKIELLPKIFEALDVDANYLFGLIKDENEKSTLKSSAFQRRLNDLSIEELKDTKLFVDFLRYKKDHPSGSED